MLTLVIILCKVRLFIRVDLDEDKNEMTSDTYLTKYPKFASADLSNELTNVGYFFDNNDNNDYINLQNRITFIEL